MNEARASQRSQLIRSHTSKHFDTLTHTLAHPHTHTLAHTHTNTYQHSNTHTDIHTNKNDTRTDFRGCIDLYRPDSRPRRGSAPRLPNIDLRAADAAGAESGSAEFRFPTGRDNPPTESTAPTTALAGRRHRVSRVQTEPSWPRTRQVVSGRRIKSRVFSSI